MKQYEQSHLSTPQVPINKKEMLQRLIVPLYQDVEYNETNVMTSLS